MVRKYNGIEYNTNADGRIQYTQLHGCYFETSVYNKLSAPQQAIALGWLKSIFDKHHMMHENEAMIIHSLYAYGLINAEEQCDPAPLEYVLSLDAFAKARQNDNKPICLMCDYFMGDIVDDRFKFVYNTLKRNNCIEEAGVADRKRKVGGIV